MFLVADKLTIIFGVVLYSQLSFPMVCEIFELTLIQLRESLFGDLHGPCQCRVVTELPFKGKLVSYEYSLSVCLVK